jgi:HSP20 family molecular chaperone IbpA
MVERVSQRWMWAEACTSIERAERLQKQFFEPKLARRVGAVWEPPVDIFETEQALWVVVALPGVGPDDLQVTIENEILIVVGRRVRPIEARGAAIHRLELPHGHFERRIALPFRRWQIGQRELANGCLTISLYQDG